MYKFGVVCFLLAASLVMNGAAKMTEEQKSKIYAKLLTSGVECMKDFPLNVNVTLRARKVPDDEVGKCFTHCLFKSLGIIDDAGKLSEENATKAAKNYFQENDEMITKVEELFSKCIHVNDAETSDGDKGCDRAKLAFECFSEHASELGFDVEFNI